MNNAATISHNSQPKTAKEIIAANVQSLIAQLEAGHSDALTAYLNAMSRFHNYSFGNILEIARQKSEATKVARLWKWKELGRSVKKGEKGIRTSFPSRRVTRVLDQAIERFGKPQAIRCDNGPELCSRHFLAWAIERKIDLLHIRPGKPTENAYVESFHGRLRDECLNTSWFWNLFDARRKIAAWQQAYNSTRPHFSLGYETPNEFAHWWRQAATLAASQNAREGEPDQAFATLRPARLTLTTTNVI